MTRIALQVTQDLVSTRLDLDAPEGSLKVMQRAVGGYVERVHTQGLDFDMYANAEGLFEPDPTVNLVATGFAHTPIVGDVIFTGSPDSEGNTTGLTEEQTLVVALMLAGARRFLRAA